MHNLMCIFIYFKHDCKLQFVLPSFLPCPIIHQGVNYDQTKGNLDLTSLALSTVTSTGCLKTAGMLDLIMRAHLHDAF